MRTLNVLALALVLVAGLLPGCAADTEEPGTSSGALTEHASFDVFVGADGEHYFELNGSDGALILGSEGYSSRTAALHGLLSVVDNGVYAGLYRVVDQADGQAYFVLRAANYEDIAASPLFASHDAAAAGISAAVQTMNDYQEWLANRTGARFEVFRGADGRFYFNLHAANGEIVLRSQGYALEESAWNGCFSVADNGTKVARYDVRQAANGQWYFNLTATNGQVIGTSELYVSKYNAERGRNGVIALLPTVDVL